MPELASLARALLLAGALLAALGGLLLFLGRVPGLGRLPGDIVYRRDGFTLYLPLATSIVSSLLLTLVLRLLRR